MSRLLFIFVDGVGVAPDDPATNAFTASPPPCITDMLREGRATLCPLDANLEVAGLPQSGTGQFTLFTGTNGAARFKRHYGPWVPTALRRELMKDNILTRAQQTGRAVAFANAYPEEMIAAAGYPDHFKPVGPLRAGAPLVAAGARVLNRHAPELEQGNAVSSEITNDNWREKLNRTTLPIITAHTAGRNLASIAMAHDLTLYAHYTTDTAGHAQDLRIAIDALHKFDAFIGGVIDGLPGGAVLVIASDHGNLEDTSGDHTRNPAFGLVSGPHHRERAASLDSLLDVTPAILSWL